MKKSELIETVHKLYPFLTLEQVISAVNIIFLSLVKGLHQGARVEIRGFGSFALRARTIQLRFADKPRYMEFGEKNNVYFRMGKDLFDRLNEK